MGSITGVYVLEEIGEGGTEALVENTISLSAYLVEEGGGTTGGTKKFGKPKNKGVSPENRK